MTHQPVLDYLLRRFRDAGNAVLLGCCDVIIATDDDAAAFLTDWVGEVPGGAGAVREFAEALLGARGEWTCLVEGYVEECVLHWRSNQSE